MATKKPTFGLSLGTAAKFNMSKAMPKQVIPTHYAGSMTCYVQENDAFVGGKITFVTLHDTHANHRSFVPFINSQFMDRVRDRARFIHLVMPGHDKGDFPWAGDEYPTCDEIAHDVNDVLDALGYRTCICLGDGAGANILCRFSLQYPNRCLGLIAIDLLSTSATLQEQLFHGMGSMSLGGGKWAEKAKHMAGGMIANGGGSSSNAAFGILPENLNRYAECYMRRTDIGQLLSDGLSCEVLLISGQFSANAKKCRRVLRHMDKTHTTFMQFDKTNDILEERHEQLARALVLFSKSCGVLLGVPMFGLEAAYDRVARKTERRMIEEGDADVTRQIARQMISHEKRLELYLDGEHRV